VQNTTRPMRRSALRLKLGKLYYGLLRYLLWLKLRRSFAAVRQAESLPYRSFAHRTPLVRKLRNVDLWMQENKTVNLRLAAARMDGLILRPGEIFSYWRLIGRPSRRKGYLPGMILRNGSFYAGTGGGLCQLSNLIYWMTLHTPLRVIERHRHGYDVFPDADRTQPFGSGATCFYPYGDLMIRNDTTQTYQLRVRVGEAFLEGEWRVSEEPRERFAVVERGHEFRGEYWGGYTRHNQLYRQRFDLEGNLLEETLAAENSAVAMYAPLLESEEQPPRP
jgi:vancomycin resistance protein VanW